jgi:hypothetical protein
VRFAWEPQPGPQLAAIMADWCPELFFGGARGGGKSEFLLGDYLQGVPEYGPNWQGILVRRSFPELQEVVKRSYGIYSLVGAEWKEGAKEWRFPNGACLKMRFLENFADTMHYQGHEYQWIGNDELPQWAQPDSYSALNACLRCSKAEVKKKRRRSTGNPGGPGHQWVKNRFIDPAPGGYTPIIDPETKETRMFIPSKVQDNRILLDRDPGYLLRLKGSGSAELVRAWLEGDWNVVQGAYFDNFSRCIIKPCRLEPHLMRFRSYDHGHARPFSVGWWAVADGEQHPFAAGDLIRYREWYGMKPGEPNIGLRLTIDEIAAGITERSRGEEYAYSVADPSIFAEDGGPSISEMFRKNGILFRAADNKRIPGWEQIRYRLAGRESNPGVWCFDTCTDSIRTIPALQHDIHKPEDLNTESEDHPIDEWRYGVTSRPWVSEAVKPNVYNDRLGQNIIDEIFNANTDLYRRL